MNDGAEREVAEKLGIALARVKAVRAQVAADLQALIVAEGSPEACARFRETATAASMRHVLAALEATAALEAAERPTKKAPPPEGTGRGRKAGRRKRNA